MDAATDAVRRLAPLRSKGFHVLANRAWPGQSDARVDLIVIGPSGVFLIDTTSWSQVRTEGGRIYRGDTEVSDVLAQLSDLGSSTEDAMADIGLAPIEVHVVSVLGGRRGIKGRMSRVTVVGGIDLVNFVVARGNRLSPSQVELALEVANQHFPALTPTEESPVLGGSRAPDPGASDAEVDAALAAASRAQPIEDWMSFLDPEQARVVRRNFGGPSRIRGAVGTGKTVVGLHRAAYLARCRPGTVLVTTSVPTLPAVLAQLMKRMAPDVAGRVEFISTHAFAKRLLTDRGVPHNLQPKIAEAEFDFAWRAVGARGVLGGIDRDPAYWHDEIEHFIKGRGITDFEEYAVVARAGRRRALSVDLRREVWTLYLAYQDRLAAKNAHDFADIVALAETSLAETPLTEYSAAIVDEAQDLTVSMIRMLHHLVGNRPDGLTLIADSRQAIYPGAYTLREVGISVSGRGAVMNTNYRNTGEILVVADSVVADHGVDDPDDPIEPVETRVTRHGEVPVVKHFTSRVDHDAAMLARIRELTREPGTDFSDIGVLSLDSFGVTAALSALRKANIPVIEIQAYDGRAQNAVKVGTVKRAKGLEFKQVMLSQVKGSLLVDTLSSDDATIERHELQRRELYVGMTRARDGLWLGVLP